ncbi:hypothetical protein H6P81_019394 [Aristolochia fimbriata]|uniref:RanBP2-type domain-containing protein n=1 Tax=Aristolochia fimbriata TaxID=158543 RepID=A0AAV7DSG9_ARIFI|nr:hypothetical protein H6P81_019394 [Aristolochia fimbriata]
MSLLFSLKWRPLPSSFGHYHLFLSFFSHRQKSPRNALSPLPVRNWGRVMASPWACSKCTYLNPPAQKFSCEVCLAPSSPSVSAASASSSSASNPSLSLASSQWSCKACTFINTYDSGSCEVCGTRSSALEGLGGVGEEDELDASVGKVFLPLQSCKRKSRDNGEVSPFGNSGNEETSKKKAALVPEDYVQESPSETLKFLSYNVWFREDLEMHKRMQALGELIQQHSPDFISFQEVTPNIFDIFRQSKWWSLYKCSVSDAMAAMRPYFCILLSKLPVKSFTCKPFDNSIMGRELCIADINIGLDVKFLLATSHLESPCPGPPTWDQMFSKERVAQAKEALDLLKESPNVIFGGDMNWDEMKDGPIPLRDEWVDAWASLRPEENGWTYDTKANPMLSGNRNLQKRLDRFLCKLRDFRISHIEMIGQEAIPGVSYIKEKKVRKEVRKLQLPVLPSDHYGLLLTINKI